MWGAADLVRVAAGLRKGRGSVVEILECREREGEERMTIRVFVYALIPC